MAEILTSTGITFDTVTDSTPNSTLDALDLGYVKLSTGEQVINSSLNTTAVTTYDKMYLGGKVHNFINGTKIDFSGITDSAIKNFFDRSNATMYLNPKPDDSYKYMFNPSELFVENFNELLTPAYKNLLITDQDPIVGDANYIERVLLFSMAQSESLVALVLSGYTLVELFALFGIDTREVGGAIKPMQIITQTEGYEKDIRTLLPKQAYYDDVKSDYYYALEVAGELYIDFGTISFDNNVSSFMDRSDVTIWNELARGASYDSLNPKRWKASEFTQAIIDDWSVELNKVFIDPITAPTHISDIKSVRVYSVAKTE